MKPVFGITAGDPAGIGPEIVLKTFARQSEIFNNIQPVVFTDPAVLLFYADLLNLPVKINIIKRFADIKTDMLNCYHTYSLKFPVDIGKITAESGKLAFESIRCAIEFASQKQIKSVITAPISKESLKAAKVPYLDHTEIFGKLTNSKDTMTLFVTGQLRVFFLTRHIQFKDITKTLNQDMVADSLKMCQKYLDQIGIKSPKIALAALNPHGGERGLFGTEEMEILHPAVKAVRLNGIDAVGPVPADSVFHLAHQGNFDAVLSLCHDQGHIAAKTLDFHRTVSLTMGLPFLRTSVDHGTGFDIAGKGTASEISLAEAVKAAKKYAW